MADENAPRANKFYAAVLQTTGEYVVHEFEQLSALVAFLRDLVDHDASVFCFSGVQLKISKPPFRYLITPDGPQPLFELPSSQELEADDTGYLGVDPVHFEDPPQIQSPRPVAANSDEFFSDDDDGVGIFDSALPDPDN